MFYADFIFYLFYLGYLMGIGFSPLLLHFSCRISAFAFMIYWFVWFLVWYVQLFELSCGRNERDNKLALPRWLILTKMLQFSQQRKMFFISVRPRWSQSTLSCPHLKRQFRNEKNTQSSDWNPLLTGRENQFSLLVKHVRHVKNQYQVTNWKTLQHVPLNYSYI